MPARGREERPARCSEAVPRAVSGTNLFPAPAAEYAVLAGKPEALRATDSGLHDPSSAGVAYIPRFVGKNVRSFFPDQACHGRWFHRLKQKMMITPAFKCALKRDSYHRIPVAGSGWRRWKL